MMNENIEIFHQNQKESAGHILVVSSHLQGHAAPLMKLSHKITKYGIKVTFLTMDLTHARAAAESSDQLIGSWKQGLRIVSVPSGMEIEGGWRDQKKLHDRVQEVLPAYMEDLLMQSQSQSKSQISGVIVDSPLTWMLPIPKKMGFKTAVYWCSNAACLALGFKIPHLLQSKFIDADGTPLMKNETLKLLPNTPEMRATDVIWYFPSDKDMQKSMFHAIKDICHYMSSGTADWIIGNWFHHLDPSATAIAPNILPLGPLLADGGPSAGSFCAEDSTCLTWLDNQPENSVVYVAFGSTSRFSQRQLDELAAGLELMGRPFLWVAWSGLTEGSSTPAYSREFAERVAGRGKMVEWAPQEAVLGHPATACFVTHCGWNSFVESVSNGVPVVCWPYFGDQMYTQRCACDGWKVGVRLEGAAADGIVSRDEIKRRVDEIVSNGLLRENALRFKAMATESIQEGGTSAINLNYLLQQMKY
ncbi:hypothetical protein C2S53_010139 [Perilla frutescens var. hirtella]|uniref:Glycosyltransferase n=1 Tax=Perilla frutescens var. hirtella TaxID=608512 RepID=A0AAD4JBB1_PERFH|nr:hypothetical protein C2S53_010139 [Perilla frutescens var. hirtella]